MLVVLPAVALAVRVRVPAPWAPATDPVTPEGRPLTVNVGVPVKPPIAFTLITVDEVVVWGSVIVVAAGTSVKPGGGLTVSATVVVPMVVPEVPVIVTFTGPPMVAVELAVSVTVLVVLVGLGVKVAVTPVGRPVATRVIAPLKPLAPWMVKTSEPEAPP